MENQIIIVGLGAAIGFLFLMRIFNSASYLSGNAPDRANGISSPCPGLSGMEARWS